MDYKDYYDILGVPEDADSQQIKRAYRKLAQQYHPDANLDNRAEAEARFKEINEAYEVLRDEEKRARFDQIRHSYASWQRRGGQPGGFDWSQWVSSQPGGVRVEYSGSGADAFSDFFRVIFGGLGGMEDMGGMGGRQAPGGFGLEDLFGGGSVRGGSARQVRGQDLQTDVDISLEEAYHGTTRIVTKNGRRLQVKIPRGARTGTKVRVAGEGAPGARGEAGDLYLNVTVQDDARFTREGDDLYVDTAVDLYTAVLGGQVEVPTLTGRVTLRVNPGTQPGQLIRLSGKGMPRLREAETYGDLYVRIHVDIPRNLNDQERELFERLATLR